MSDDLFMLGLARHYGLVSGERFASAVAESLKPGPLVQELMREPFVSDQGVGSPLFIPAEAA